MRIYLIEFHAEGDRWIPTGQPLYNREDAKKKLKRYRSRVKTTEYRIAVYERDGPASEYVNLL